jgi:tetratricopeptide (TPR) repeat protein
MRYLTQVAVLIAGLSAAPAFCSEGSTAAFELYRAGNYEAAIAAGEAANDAEALAVAARAAFAEANLGEKPCLACLQRVEGLARRSLTLDTMHPEGFVYLAAALGYEARIVGNIRAQLARYPDIAKDALDKALSVAPDDAWSLASTGAWHIEVVRGGGSFLARSLYGARIETGEDYFRRAFAADPANPVIRFQYALTVSGYDFSAYRDRAKAQLAAAAMLEPRTAYERAIQKRALRLLDLINANKRAEYLALVDNYQGYP